MTYWLMHPKVYAALKRLFRRGTRQEHAAAVRRRQRRRGQHRG